MLERVMRKPTQEIQGIINKPIWRKKKEQK